MKFRNAVATTGAFLMLFGTAYAFDMEAGDANKGKETYQKCRRCHDGGKAKNLSPAHKTKKQWHRYFKKDFKKLKKKMPDFSSFGYSDTELQDIHQYLVGSALDSEKPQTCD
jgi:cytochrome c553